MVFDMSLFYSSGGVVLELLRAILLMMGRVLLDSFTSPYFVLLYISLFLLVAWQYRRLQNFSVSRFKNHPVLYLKPALVSTLLGILGGVLGSVLLVILGVDLSGIGITQLWLVALLLMLIQPRFLCFAYAAGVLGMANLLLGYPHIDIPQLMALVAILHMVESLLILLNGSFYPLPVYVKKPGGLRGGFNLQLFWPIPLVALMSMGFTEAGNSGLQMPAWWPLLQNYASLADDKTYALLPVIAVLGYGEITTTRTPFQASRKSALYLFLFSLLLLFLAVLAAYSPVFLPLAVVFSPLGHELVIWLGMRAETRPPLYTQPPLGLMVLDILSGSPADRAGLRSRDIILTVNGQNLDNYAALQELAADKRELNLEVQRSNQLKNMILRYHLNENPGIIPVPDRSATKYLALEDDQLFLVARRIWKRIKSRTMRN